MSECKLGLEFSGRDPQGRRVMGLVSSIGMATTVAADPDWIWEVTDAWSLEEASTVPVAYSTAYYALLVRANLQPGESLLVHTGTTDVGQAAISIALSMGCIVFTTVGSQEEREFLKCRFQQLEDRNIANYWDMACDELEVRANNGRGVDLMLNSLFEEKLRASVRCSPITSPITVEAVASTYFYEYKSYVIVGGLCGVGLELADWMVGRGCRRILLNSRSGVQNGYQKLCLRRWRQAGAEMRVVMADVTTEEGACQIIETALVMGPVGGIFNLAVASKTMPITNLIVQKRMSKLMWGQ